MIKYASVKKELVMIPLKPGRFPVHLFPQQRRVRIQMQPFFQTIMQKRLSSPLLYLAPPPYKREKHTFALRSASSLAATA